MHTWSVFLPISIMDNTIHYMRMYTLYSHKGVIMYTLGYECIYSGDMYFVCPANFIHCMNCIVDTYHVSRMCVLFLREPKCDYLAKGEDFHNLLVFSLSTMARDHEKPASPPHASHMILPLDGLDVLLKSLPFLSTS